ncbi:hypothetical protein D3C86_1492850 [compost metagenome]
MLYSTHFILGGQPRTQLVNPGRQRNHLRGFQAIPGEHDDIFNTSVAQSTQRLRSFAPNVVRENQQASEFPIHVDEASTARQVVHVAQHGGGPVGYWGFFVRKRQRAETHSHAIDPPTKSRAWAFFYFLRNAERQLTLMRCFNNGLGDGVRRGLRQRSGQAEQALRIAQPVDLYRLQAGMAAGQRTGLVEKHLLDPGQRFQGRAVLDQDPAPRGPRNT